jgi:hypothetical protein
MRRAALLGVLVAAAGARLAQAQAPCGIEYVYAGSRLLAMSGSVGTAPTVGLATTWIEVQEDVGGPGLAVEILVTTANGCALAADAAVTYSTQDGTAQSPPDYAAEPGRLLPIPRGTDSGTVLVVFIPIENDSLAELDETFTVRLSGPQGIAIRAPLGTPMDSATITIHDDDAPRVSLFLGQGGSIAEINEDNSWVVGPVKARVTTKGGGPLPEELRVGWRPEGGSAVPNEDYAANPLYATTFPQGAPSGTELDIGAGIVYQDAVLEPDESFNVGLLASGQLSSSGIYSTDPSPISNVIKDDDTSPPHKLNTI